jgi:hypothetical protein
MRFAHIAGLAALVYINLVESEFLLSYSSEPVYKKDLTEREVHTANGLVNKSVFKRVKKEGKIAFIRNTQINENEIQVRLPLKESLEIPNSYKLYKDRIAKIAKELGIPYERLAAHLHQESSFNQTSDKTGKTLTGDKGTAFGIGQIRAGARKDVENYLGRSVNLDDPEDNIRTAGLYWKLQKEKYGAKTDDEASRMYNTGPTPKGDAGLKYQQDITNKLKLYKQQKNQTAQLVKPKTDPNKKSAGQIEFEKDPMAYRLKYGGDEFDA